MHKPLVIDLFAGAGGLSSGLTEAGYSVVFANEIEKPFSETLRFNHKDTEVSVDDIRNLNPKLIRKSLCIAKGELDLIVGGPPCQGFSINAPIRSSEDVRNHLFLNYLSFVKEFRPKVSVIENVPGMISFEKGDTIKAIILAFGDLGYQVDFKVLYMPHYGIPQMRWRTIVIATRDSQACSYLYPEPTHFAKGRANFATSFMGNKITLLTEEFEALVLNEKVTVDDAIGDLPPIDNGKGDEVQSYISQPLSDYQKTLRAGSDMVYNHVCAGLGSINLQRLPFIPQGGSWRDIPYELLPAGMKRARRSDHTKRYGRLHPKEIASTILTKCDPHWGTYIHPTQDRVISVREAARFQSFPDNYVFQGNLADQYKQVGNAVPPLFSKALGNRIKTYLSGNLVERLQPKISQLEML